MIGSVSGGRVAAALAALALAAPLAGCTNRESPRARPPSDSGPPVPAVRGSDGVQRVTLEVDDRLRYRPAVVLAAVGRIEISLHNTGRTPHDLAFATLPVGVRNVESGATTTATFTVTRPGSYPFACDYHERLGMTGRLVVR